VILEYGSKASGSDMMIESYVSKAVRMMIVGVKDGNPWRIGSRVFKYGDKCGVRS